MGAGAAAKLFKFISILYSLAGCWSGAGLWFVTARDAAIVVAPRGVYCMHTHSAGQRRGRGSAARYVNEMLAAWPLSDIKHHALPPTDTGGMEWGASHNYYD